MQEPNPSHRYRRPESVLVVVYVSAGQVLMLERCQPAGYWQSVTGSLEWGENPAHCARRELREETGIDAQPEATGVVNRFEIMPQWRERYGQDVTENTEYVYSLRLPGICELQLSPDEHLRYEWLEAETAIERCFSSTNAEAIRQIVLET